MPASWDLQTQGGGSGVGAHLRVFVSLHQVIALRKCWEQGCCLPVMGASAGAGTPLEGVRTLMEAPSTGRHPSDGRNLGGDGQGEQRKGLGAAGAEVHHICFSKRNLNRGGKPRERII